MIRYCYVGFNAEYETGSRYIPSVSTILHASPEEGLEGDIIKPDRPSWLQLVLLYDIADKYDNSNLLSDVCEEFWDQMESQPATMWDILRHLEERGTEYDETIRTTIFRAAFDETHRWSTLHRQIAEESGSDDQMMASALKGLLTSHEGSIDMMSTHRSHADNLAKKFLLAYQELEAIFHDDLASKSASGNHNNLQGTIARSRIEKVMDVLQPPERCLWYLDLLDRASIVFQS